VTGCGQRSAAGTGTSPELAERVNVPGPAAAAAASRPADAQTLQRFISQFH